MWFLGNDIYGVGFCQRQFLLHHPVRTGDYLWCKTGFCTFAIIYYDVCLQLCSKDLFSSTIPLEQEIQYLQDGSAGTYCRYLCLACSHLVYLFQLRGCCVSGQTWVGPSSTIRMIWPTWPFHSVEKNGLVNQKATRAQASALILPSLRDSSRGFDLHCHYLWQLLTENQRMQAVHAQHCR